MRTRALCVVVAAGVCVSVCAVVSGDELYRQDPINSVGGLSSQDARNAGGLGWFSEVVDNFQAGEDWVINNVEFWGGYVTTTPGNTRGFTIRFYENLGGSVGARLFEQDVFTFSETLYYTNGSGLQGFHYSVDLSPSFVVPAPRSYWVSVVAILDRGGTASEPQWGWVDATTITPPVCQQWFFSPGNFNPKNEDVAFVLNGTAGAGCPCDCNFDTTTGPNVCDIFDFLAFQDGFVSGDPCAIDRNVSTGVGIADIFDFLDFQNGFVAGCP